MLGLFVFMKRIGAFLSNSKFLVGGSLLKHFEARGFLVIAYESYLSLSRSLRLRPPDLLILDASLVDPSVVQVCASVRAVGCVIPLFVLCHTDDVSLRISVLNAGADDALSFPFSISEIDARLDALLRRSCMGFSDADGPILSYKDLTVNTDARHVSRGSCDLRLTVKEYDLLLYLLRHAGQVLSRYQLLIGVWGDNWTGDDNLLDVYVRYLRKKIEQPGFEKLIHTVRGVGFILE
jgi:DNA-binding response OmpR family regulator